ncbi:CLUMA_CG017609, isoform A [Clunio marinus]|uniref:CLUMA_CG017609, isoform A n=1 Tax=Clunio marinus TaxID=568069 RepID=A0A1J1IWQ9_9DIPT|nr:CLUMA_CG017609, isoform A [Clunio marinus]
MLSYMLPVEEKSQNPRNLSLNLNIPNSGHMQTSSEINQQERDDLIDENTKLLSIERQDYTAILDSKGNLNGNSNKYNYNMNITNNNLCSENILKPNDNKTIIKNGISSKSEDYTDTELATISETNVNNNDESISSSNDKKIIKMSKLGTKNVTLKRVSFGSSKGSMVETLIFETPTPLQENDERQFFSSAAEPESANQENGLNDSGIEMQEELERSKVRVTFFQSSKPQQISPPCSDNQFYFGDNYFNNNSLIDSFLLNSSANEGDISKMTAVIPTDYNRQLSTDSGWDNPFRPDGDLSREADEIVNLIKGVATSEPT